MGKLLIILIMLAILFFILYKIISFFGYLIFPQENTNQLYWCACGCDRKFTERAGWDGYHGPDSNNPAHWDAQMLDYKKPPKAIDYDPNNVVGWEDIQWTVEKRLPKENR